MAILIPRMINRTKKQALATHRNHTKKILYGAIAAIEHSGYTWDLRELTDKIVRDIRELNDCVEVQYRDMKKALDESKV